MTSLAQSRHFMIHTCPVLQRGIVRTMAVAAAQDSPCSHQPEKAELEELVRAEMEAPWSRMRSCAILWPAFLCSVSASPALVSGFTSSRCASLSPALWLVLQVVQPLHARVKELTAQVQARCQP